MTNDNSSQSDRSVKDYIASLDDEQSVKDSQVLIEMMQRISGHEPKMWNAGTIGFDTYHYKYDSGREGDGHIIGFYPRKGLARISLGSSSRLRIDSRVRPSVAAVVACMSCMLVGGGYAPYSCADL